jgi:phenylacetate-CoA ligase
MNYKKFFISVLFPFYYTVLKKSKVVDKVNDTNDRLLWDQKKLKDYQWQQLTKLLQFCWDNVPYYKRVWQENGIESVNQIDSLDKFSKLPILTKNDVKKYYSELVPECNKEMNIKKSTGGSTGQPFHFELNMESHEARLAIAWRGYGEVGADLGTKAVYLWGASVGNVSAFRKFKEYAFHRFFNNYMLNSFEMNQNNIHQYVEKINKIKPDAMVSYVNPLVELAKYILAHNIKMHKPNTIVTGAEALYEHQRELIEKAFNCHVHNTYGCREFMLISSECKKQKGLHINIDQLVVETINEKRETVSNESGDIVITDLTNYGMPLIRYLNGDCATLTNETCDCGNPLPLMNSVDGRKLDIIKCPNGQLIPGELFPHMFKDFPWIAKFQVVQTEIEAINVKIVLNTQITSPDFESIEKIINNYSEGSLTIKFDIVGDIPLTPSGKRRVTVCKV